MLSHRNETKTPASAETILAPDQSSLFDRQEIIAPAGYVGVWHTTGIENLSSVDQVGLRTSFAQKRRVSDFIDKARPASLQALGVSRYSVYAEPFQAQHYVKGPQLELAVDPARCFVVDSKYASEVMVEFNTLGRRAKKSTGAHESAQAYWESLIPLGDFLDHYKSDDGPASERMPRYELPEVLIPYDVSSEHIRIVDNHPGILSAIHGVASQRTEGQHS